MARTQYETTSKYGMPIFDGSSTEDPSSLVPEGYSLDKAYQDQKPEDYLHSRTTRGAGKDGMETSNSKTAYYKIEKPTDSAPEAPQPDKEPTAPEAPTPVELSPEIQQAKERVKNYEASIDGTAGSLFQSNETEPAVENDAEKEAQGFADKYKLNLMDGVGLNL